MKGERGMRLDIIFGSGVISLPEKAIDILNDLSHAELKLLVYLCSDREIRENFSISEASSFLGMQESEISSAVQSLSLKGILSSNASENQSGVTVRRKKTSGVEVTVIKSGSDLPSYTGAEIETLFANRSELGKLVEDCQRILGKMFTLIEINRIINLADQYRLGCDYITTLCIFAEKIGRPTVPYVEKTALKLYEDGIVSLTDLEKRLAEMEEFSTLEGFVRRLFGLGTRKLTAKESKFVEQWVQMKYPEKMIELAYEISVNNTGTPSMPYINKTLLNWSEAGYTTTEQALAAMEKFRIAKNEGNSSRQNERKALDPLEEAILASSKNRARKLLDDAGDGGK